MKDGGPAFPTEHGYNSSGEVWDRRGMSLRDWFAGKAPPPPKWWMESDSDNVATSIAEWNYIYADAMLSEREKR